MINNLAKTWRKSEDRELIRWCHLTKLLKLSSSWRLKHGKTVLILTSLRTFWTFHPGHTYTRLPDNPLISPKGLAYLTHLTSTPHPSPGPVDATWHWPPGTFFQTTWHLTGNHLRPILELRTQDWFVFNNVLFTIRTLFFLLGNASGFCLVSFPVYKHWDPWINLYLLFPAKASRLYLNSFDDAVPERSGASVQCHCWIQPRQLLEPVMLWRLPMGSGAPAVWVLPAPNLPPSVEAQSFYAWSSDTSFCNGDPSI